MIGLQSISKLKIKVIKKRKKRKSRIKVSPLQIPKNVKRNNYVNDNKDDFGYFTIEKFMVRNNIIFTPSLEEYSKGNRPLKRQLLTYAYYIILWIFGIKFAIIALINKPWIYTLLSDPFYILRQNHLPVIMYGLCILTAIVGQQTSLTFERNMKFEWFSLLQRMKNNQNIYKLNDKYYGKFRRNSKFIVKIILGPIFIVGVLLNTIPFSYLSLKAYFDSEMNFSSICLTINYVLLTICWIHCSTIFAIGVVMNFWTVLYLKYHFQQIRETIQHCVKTGNSILLIDAIHEHNYFTELTEKLNEMMRVNFGMVYFCCTPALDILLHLTIYCKNLYLRSFHALFLAQAVILLFIFTFITSRISVFAHNVSSDIHKFLLRKHTTKILLINKLKISAFIEKLYGTCIGYYCFDLFPFTTFEFYQYMYFVSGTYFLLNGLIF
jgi:hypothetical protein